MIKRNLRRILLVEDDPYIQDVTTLLLSMLGGFEVKACGSAADALQNAPAFDPDLILLDFKMPGLDGQHAFEAFRQTPATATTPVIFITARVQPRAILEYRQWGSLGVIPKPFDPETLTETVQGMWDRHQATQVNESLREDLAALRRRYAAAFPESLCSIQSAAASLQENGGDADVAASLYEMAHRLAGSAAIYGYPAVTEAAQRIGRFASEQPPGRWTPSNAPPFLRLVAALVAALERPVQGAPARRVAI